MNRLPLSPEPVSLDLAWNDPEENLRRIEAALDRRLSAGPDPSERLFLFPELTLTGFVTKDPPAFTLGDAVTSRLGALAESRKTALAAGFPEKDPARPGKPFNTLALFGPDGRVLAAYRKMHLFTAGKSPESSSYSAGAEGVLCRYRGWLIGFAVCFDLRFCGLFHSYARQGADLILSSACWVGGPHKSEQFRTLNAAYAVLSQAYVAAVNRSGKDPFYGYDGAEYLFSPFGEELLSLDRDRLDEGVLAECRRMSVRPSDRPAYPSKVVDSPS